MVFLEVILTWLWILTIIAGVISIIGYICSLVKHDRVDRHGWRNVFLVCIVLFFVFPVLMNKVDPESSDSDRAKTSKTTKKMVKNKKETLNIYPVDVSNIKVEEDGDDDFFITIKGNTDAPDGSILYAQHPVKDQIDDNKAYGGKYDNGPTKIKNGKFSFSVLLSELVDTSSIKAGQKIYLKIFCTNQKFSDYDDMESNDSEFINKKVRKRLNQEDIDPAIIKITQKMVNFVN